MSADGNTVTVSSRGKSVTMDTEEMDGVMERLQQSEYLEFDERIWERLQDRINAQYRQVVAGTRAVAHVGLTFAIGRDKDEIPTIKIKLTENAGCVGEWNRSEGGQLTLEGL
jgi:hypothetical protein